MSKSMEKIVGLCKRRGFIFQSSEIYGGLQGFWDYGPLGTELKRNVREAWYKSMVTNHDELFALEGAPSAFQMVGIESSIIMHPSVWKASGHFDLFHDFMVDCKSCKSRFRVDHVTAKVILDAENNQPIAVETYMQDAESTGGLSKKQQKNLDKAIKAHGKPTLEETVSLDAYLKLAGSFPESPGAACPECKGELTDPREFNLMFKTIVGALSGEKGTAFLRPETAQGMFVNFKNVVDSSRVKVPFGIAQIGKSYRNEITPRNFTFRSREFEQMEMEFFCPPEESRTWYEFWRNRRFQWYTDLGISADNLILRDHTADELAHYSVGTADIEYSYPFNEEGEYGELEGISHRGDFDLRSHMEGKLVPQDGCLVVEEDENGKPKHRGSGKDLTYFDDQTRERYVPHVIEPAAGADRATLAFICEAYTEDEQPDDKGEMQSRTLMRFHPQLAPVKAAVFPLIKKEGMPEKATEIYRELKKAGVVSTFSQQGAIGRRYRQQDEIGTPFCITVDGDTMADGTVTIRERDSLKQDRIPAEKVVEEIRTRIDNFSF